MDYIIHFEYTKKNLSEIALGIAGNLTFSISDFIDLKQRMKELGYFEFYLNDNPDVFNMFI